MTLILKFNLALGICFGIPFILSGLFCVSDYVFKRKEYEDNEIFYHRYMYISGFITATTCAFLVGFGVVPFAMAASLVGPFVCVSLCFFIYRLVCFAKSRFQRPCIEVLNSNGPNILNKFENEQNQDLQTPGLVNKSAEKK